WKDFVDQGYVIAGSPETVRQQIEHVAKSLNVGHMMLLLHFGNMSREAVTKNTTLFAREVMPHVRHLFTEWQDRWWINPIPSAVVGPLAQASPDGLPVVVSPDMPSLVD